jgi:hypothetical protein
MPPPVKAVPPNAASVSDTPCPYPSTRLFLQKSGLTDEEGSDDGTEEEVKAADPQKRRAEFELHTFKDSTKSLPHTVYICNTKEGTMVGLKPGMDKDGSTALLLNWGWWKIDTMKAIRDEENSENMDMLLIQGKIGTMQFECENAVLVRDSILDRASVKHGIIYEAGEYDITNLPKSTTPKDTSNPEESSPKKNMLSPETSFLEERISPKSVQPDTSRDVSLEPKRDKQPRASGGTSIQCKNCRSKFLSVSGLSTHCQGCRKPSPRRSTHKGRDKVQCVCCKRAFYTTSGKSLCPDCRADKALEERTRREKVLAERERLKREPDRARKDAELLEREREAARAVANQEAKVEAAAQQQRSQAQQKATQEAEEKARQEASKQAKQEAGEQARQEQARIETEQYWRREAEEQARQDAVEAAEAAEQERWEIEEQARQDAVEAADAVEQKRWELEEQARQEAAEAADQERWELEEQARQKAVQAAEQARQKAAAEQARQIRKQAEQQTRRAEEQAKQEAVEQEKWEVDEQARQEVAEAAEQERWELDEQARQKVAEAAEQERWELDEQARQEAAEEAEQERCESEEEADEEEEVGIEAEVQVNREEQDIRNTEQQGGEQAKQYSHQASPPSSAPSLVLTVATSTHDWLMSVNPHLDKYGPAFIEYGYEDVSLLLLAAEEELNEALDSMEAKKPHRKMILTAFQELKSAARASKKQSSPRKTYRKKQGGAVKTAPASLQSAASTFYL